MCELPGNKLDEATRGIDAVFAPHLQRAEALADKIAKAAKTCREADGEDIDQDPWSTQP